MPPHSVWVGSGLRDVVLPLRPWLGWNAEKAVQAFDDGRLCPGRWAAFDPSICKGWVKVEAFSARAELRLRLLAASAAVNAG